MHIDGNRLKQGCINGAHKGWKGFVWMAKILIDRMKDVIKTGGEWVSSLELEDIVLQHEAVSEAAVIGVPDDKWGERPLALVVLKDGYRDKVAPEDIKAFYMSYVEKGLISKWGVPDKIVFTDAIARTSVGKLDKKVLRQQYG